jgi:hypothetical protein
MPLHAQSVHCRNMLFHLCHLHGISRLGPVCWPGNTTKGGNQHNHKTPACTLYTAASNPAHCTCTRYHYTTTRVNWTIHTQHTCTRQLNPKCVCGAKQGRRLQVQAIPKRGQSGLQEKEQGAGLAGDGVVEERWGSQSNPVPLGQAMSNAQSTPWVVLWPCNRAHCCLLLLLLEVACMPTARQQRAGVVRAPCTCPAPSMQTPEGSPDKGAHPTNSSCDRCWSRPGVGHSPHTHTHTHSPCGFAG